MTRSTSPNPLSRRGRADMDRALHNLEGILQGITIDGRLNDGELNYLRKWMLAHEYLFDVEPMQSISEVLQQAVEEGVIQSESHGDLIENVRLWSTPNQFYDDITADMQRLHGIMAGIAADEELNDEEIKGLIEWLQSHHQLEGIWPYDDIVNIVSEILDKGLLNSKKRKVALEYLKEFGGRPLEAPINHDSHKEHRQDYLNSSNPIMSTLSDVCEKNPDITIAGHEFCFTGKANSGARAELETWVLMANGRIGSVKYDLDYLVIGGASSPLWTYATYGRKIESVMQGRQSGSNTLIVHEDDFIKALNSQKSASPPANIPVRERPPHNYKKPKFARASHDPLKLSGLWTPETYHNRLLSQPPIPKEIQYTTSGDWVGAYRAIVRSWSFKALRSFFPKSDAESNNMQLKNKFPCVLGFNSGVLEEVIASPVNLELLPIGQNPARILDPDKALDDLLHGYVEWAAKNPSWTEMIAYRRAHNTWPQSKQVVARKYENDEARNETHGLKTEPVYKLWRHGYKKDAIAKILSMTVSKLSGRIQLDKKYFGPQSIFYSKFDYIPLPDEVISRISFEQRALRGKEESERVEHEKKRGGIVLTYRFDELGLSVEEPSDFE